MKTYYARVARGRTAPTRYGCSFAGFGASQTVEGVDRVDAFFRLYSELGMESSNISAIKPHGAARVLDFDEVEWERVRASGIDLPEGFPERIGEGIQIEAIRETPF